MIIIYNKKTGHITATVFSRRNNFPLPTPNEGEQLIEIEHDGKNIHGEILIEPDLFERIEKGKDNLLSYKLVDDAICGKRFEKKEQIKQVAPACFRFNKTVIIDTENPQLDKDVVYYNKRAIQDRLITKSYFIDKILYLFVLKDNEIISEQRFTLISDKVANYSDAILFKRISFPHYLGLYEAIDILKKKGIKEIDLMFLVNDPTIDNFKKKWGKITETNMRI